MPVSGRKLIFEARPVAGATGGLDTGGVKLVSDREARRWNGRQDRLRALTFVYVLGGLAFIAIGIDGETRGWSLGLLAILAGAVWIAVGANFEAVRRVVTRRAM